MARLENHGKKLGQKICFLTLFEKSLTNKKTKHFWYSKLVIQPYITSLDPATA